MSVSDRNVIDHIYFEDNKIILGISDHLPWDNESIVSHWEILQDKLRDYVGYIYSGQLKQSYPDLDKTPCIKIFISESYPEVVEKYLKKMKMYYIEYGYELVWALDSPKK